MKFTLRLALCILVVALLSFTPGCGKKGKVIVTVNKEGIERSLFEKRLERRYGGEILNILVQEALTLQYAEKNKLLPTEAETKAELAERKQTIKEETKKEWEQYLEDRDQTEEEFTADMEIYLASFKIATKGVKVTDDEVKKFYDDMVAALQAPFYQYEQIHLFHIESKQKETIDKAYDMLKKGASWETVALQMSEAADKNSAGDMSWAIVSEEGAIGFPNPRAPAPLRPFRPEMEEKILKIPVGRYSEPLEVSLFDGAAQSWQIFRITEKKDQKTVTFKRAKLTATRLLVQAKARENETAQKEIENYQKFLREAKIKAFEEKYLSLNK